MSACFRVSQLTTILFSNRTGLVLRANKRYSQTVSKTFHLSQATLDVNKTGADADIQVTLTSDNENYILCTLSKKKDVLQVPLDLVFSEGDEISFSSNGEVHLTGYLIPNDEFDGYGPEGDDEELDEEEEDEEVPELVPAAAKKLSKKQLELKKLLEAELQQDDEEDSDFDEEAGDAEDVDEEEDDDEEDDDEDDDDDSEEDDEEEEIAEPVAKKQKQSNGVANGKAEKVQPKKQEQPQPKVAQQESKEKVLQGGVKVEDIRVGKGPEAKPGKKVQVRCTCCGFVLVASGVKCVLFIRCCRCTTRVASSPTTRCSTARRAARASPSTWVAAR